MTDECWVCGMPGFKPYPYIEPWQMSCKLCGVWWSIDAAGFIPAKGMLGELSAERAHP